MFEANFLKTIFVPVGKRYLTGAGQGTGKPGKG